MRPAKALGPPIQSGSGFTGTFAPTGGYTMTLRCACGAVGKVQAPNYTGAAAHARALGWVLRLSACVCKKCAAVRR